MKSKEKHLCYIIDFIGYYFSYLFLKTLENLLFSLTWHLPWSHTLVLSGYHISPFWFFIILTFKGFSYWSFERETQSSSVCLFSLPSGCSGCGRHDRVRVGGLELNPDPPCSQHTVLEPCFAASWRVRWQEARVRSRARTWTWPLQFRMWMSQVVTAAPDVLLSL